MVRKGDIVLMRLGKEWWLIAVITDAERNGMFVLDEYDSYRKWEAEYHQIFNKVNSDRYWWYKDEQIIEVIDRINIS